MIISETCESLWHVLQNKLFESSEHGWLEIAKGFENCWNFPHCIGALYGTHIQVKAPPHSGSLFYNYKGYHSINLMAIASARYKFLMVDVGSESRVVIEEFSKILSWATDCSIIKCIYLLQSQ